MAQEPRSAPLAKQLTDLLDKVKLDAIEGLLREFDVLHRTSPWKVYPYSTTRGTVLEWGYRK